MSHSATPGRMPFPPSPDGMVPGMTPLLQEPLAARSSLPWDFSRASKFVMLSRCGFGEYTLSSLRFRMGGQGKVVPPFRMSPMLSLRPLSRAWLFLFLPLLSFTGPSPWIFSFKDNIKHGISFSRPYFFLIWWRAFYCFPFFVYSNMDLDPITVPSIDPRDIRTRPSRYHRFVQHDFQSSLRFFSRRLLLLPLSFYPLEDCRVFILSESRSGSFFLGVGRAPVSPVLLLFESIPLAS